MIEKLLRFISENKEILIMAAEALAALIIFLVKKKPIKIVDNARTFITLAAAEAIKAVERPDLKGNEKKQLARQLILEALTKEGFGRYADLIKQYSDYIDTTIENILSTPQKKEAKK